ncbi:MAG: DUF4876 domain-containing protein [Candidatus Cryptobacteroides sp.]
MKRLAITYLSALSLVLCGCLATQKNPFEPSLCRLEVKVDWPEGYEYMSSMRVELKAEEINLGYSYSAFSEEGGKAVFKLRRGLYLVSLAVREGSDIFNGSADKVLVNDSLISLRLPLSRSKSGSIVIKEIYCGGCMKTPEQGTYQNDQYVILHNNDYEVQYLDSLCFGTLYPYNAMATNPFLSRDDAGNIIYPDYAPIAQCVWRFGGKGKSFPLQAGEDAVLCLRGAIDHSASYPLSVNLNREGYFVCYNNVYFPNTSYHPVPGDKIDPQRYLDVVVKTGIANAYTFSINSPTALIFRLKADPELVQVPGSTVDRVAAIPYEDVIDAVEVFSGASSANAKRLIPSLDAGYVKLSNTFLGHSLIRLRDEELSASSGYEVLVDTNNSSNDFYESEIQSLHD